MFSSRKNSKIYSNVSFTMLTICYVSYFFGVSVKVRPPEYDMVLVSSNLVSLISHYLALTLPAKQILVFFLKKRRKEYAVLEMGFRL